MKPQTLPFTILCLCSVVIGPALSQTSVHPLSATAKDSLLQAGIRQYTEARYGDAVQTLSVIPIDSSSAQVLYYLGLSYASVNDFQNANSSLREAVDLDTTNSPIRFQYAKFLGQFGAVDEAQVQYERIVQSDSTFYPAWFQLGVLLNGQRKFPKREAEIFARIVRHEPRDYLSLHFLGDALIRLGQFEAGRNCIATSITLNPKHFPAVSQLAGIYFAKNDFNEALRLYHQAESLRPLDPNVKFNIGECLRKLKADSAAVGYFRQALMLDSTESKYAAQLGYAYFNLKQYDSSAMAYKKAIAIDNENPQYWLNLALVYERADSAELVVDSFDRAVLASRPDKIADIYMQLGAYHYHQSSFRDAATAYSKALEFDSYLPEAHFYLGLTYEKLTNPQNAIRQYQSYLKLTEDDTTVSQRRELAKSRVDWLRKQR